MLTEDEYNLDDRYDDDLRYRAEMNKQHAALVNAQAEEPDPRIAVYYGDSPAAFVAQCCERPRDDERLRVWTDKVIAEVLRKIPSRTREIDAMGHELNWRLEQCCRDYPGQIVSLEFRCQLLRSLFPPPQLCRAVDCPECVEIKGNRWRLTESAAKKFFKIDGVLIGPPVDESLFELCECDTGKIITTEFDARWRTSSVIDLAKDITGDCGRWVNTVNAGTVLAVPASPRFDLFPLLADCLEDAGADEPAIIRHCRSGGPWVREDWLLSVILGENK